MSGYPGRLSELQKEILYVIANNTINISECQEREERYDVHSISWAYHSHDIFKDRMISYSEALFKTAVRYWDLGTTWEELDYNMRIHNNIVNNKHRVAFSNSVHNLVEKKELMGAVALAWVTVGKYNDVLAWQGGGHKKYDEEFDCWDDTPRYKLLDLTHNGWKLVQELFDDKIGMCPVLARAISNGGSSE